jgi:hypothetical protein
MSPTQRPENEASGLPEVEWAFAPVDKLAVGTALGITSGMLLFLITVYDLLLLGNNEGPNLWLLGHYLAGYEVTWPGAFIGLFWGFVVGFVGGWFIAFLRNLFTALYTFRVRTKANLQKMADFLDHI